MTYQISDLLPLDDPYLQDDRFTLVIDSQDLEYLSGHGGDGVTGALVDPEGEETWITRYRRPFDLASVYERIE